MSLRRILATTAAGLVTAGSLLAAPVAPASSGTPQTAYFDMFANPKVEPARIYLSASSGPWLKGLHWEGWGTSKAVAHGTYVSTCASCPPPKRRTATVTFSRPIACTDGEGAGYTAYRRGVVRLSKPDRGSTRTTFRIPMGCP